LQSKTINDGTSNSPNEHIEEEQQKATEGVIKEVTFFRSVRNRKIRNLCAERDKYTCQVCGFNFEKVYGERGKGFIEIHHKNPMANFDKEHEIKLEDLVALCSNCHSMIHYGGEFLDVDDLKKLHKAQTDQ
jgi:5-methylcytosine-specific restriction protein A